MPAEGFERNLAQLGTTVPEHGGSALGLSSASYIAQEQDLGLREKPPPLGCLLALYFMAFLIWPQPHLPSQLGFYCVYSGLTGKQAPTAHSSLCSCSLDQDSPSSPSCVFDLHFS